PADRAQTIQASRPDCDMARVAALIWSRCDNKASVSREQPTVERLSVRLIDRQAGDKRRLLLQAAWPACVQIEQCRQCPRFGNAVGVENPYPVQAAFQGSGKTDPNRAAGTEIRGVSDDADLLRECSVQRTIGRAIVDNQNGIRGPRLLLNRGKRSI